MIVSVVPVPTVDCIVSSNNIDAPKLSNDRVKIFWDEANLPDDQLLASGYLSKLRERWSEVSSPSSISLLLSCTNDALVSAAKATNKYIKLGKKVHMKSS